MNNQEILNKVSETLKNIFDDQSLVIQENTSADDIDEWDSLTHIQIVAELENVFQIKFALGELMGLQNVGDMVNLIQNKIS